MQTKGRILVIEDSRDVARLIRAALQEERYQVVAAKDGESGLKLARKIRPDLVVLDIGLPGMDGFAVLKILQAESRVPVILLSARRQETDRILGLKLGADDYVIKPFSAGELSARVEALLRRAAPAAEEPLAAGALRLNARTHEATVSGKPVPLEPKEFSIIRLLLEARGEVVSRELLLARVWGYSEDLGMNRRMVDQYVSRLRRKLGTQGALIVTVPTLGYKIKT